MTEDHAIFEFRPPVLRVESLQHIWKKHRPDVMPLFFAMRMREDWVVPETREESELPDRLAEVLDRMALLPALQNDHIRELVEVTAYYDAEQALYAFCWLQTNTGHANRIMRWLLDNRDDDCAGAMLYRIRMAARHQVLSDLLQAAEEYPLHRIPDERRQHRSAGHSD